ncbi:hypothetical protein SODG_003754 [Sodalis praecaptivus]
MTELQAIKNEPMMSSREIAELVGKRHDHVIRDVWEMLGQLYQIEKDAPILGDHKNQKVTIVEGVIVAIDGRGYVGEFLLDRRHTEILITGYDVKRRAAVIDRCFVLESERTLRSPVELGLPNFLDPAEAAIAWGQERKAVQRVTFERDHAIRTKAEIGSRREATAMAKASAAVRERNKLAEKLGECTKHATIVAVMNKTGKEYPWRPLRQWCLEHGGKIIRVPDARYGSVKSWPAEAWMAVHSVNLHELFREVIYA